MSSSGVMSLAGFTRPAKLSRDVSESLIKMKNNLFVVISACLLLLTSSCIASNEVKVHLDEEFSLKSGQTVVISGENLKIEFIEVTEDSRCPKGVTCIWEGRVSCLVEITYRESLHSVVLTEPGLTKFPPEQSFQEYKFGYHIEPYPEASVDIAKEEYRLYLKISK